MDYRDIKEFLSDSFKYILLIAGVILVIVYIFTFQQVVGPSMNMTLESGDITVLLKSHYKIFNVKYGDIISFEYSGSKYLIKRVIGLPGDTIEFKDNTLYRNGEVIEEPYLKDVTTDDFNLSELEYTIIPENMYFVCGDNRNDSLDSRDKRVGLVKKEAIMGRVIMRVFPFGEIKIF